MNKFVERFLNKFAERFSETVYLVWILRRYTECFLEAYAIVVLISKIDKLWKLDRHDSS